MDNCDRKVKLKSKIKTCNDKTNAGCKKCSNHCQTPGCEVHDPFVSDR